jgi:hypothetical protein
MEPDVPKKTGISARDRACVKTLSDHALEQLSVLRSCADRGFPGAEAQNCTNSSPRLSLSAFSHRLNPKRKSKERHRLSAVGPSGISTNVTYGKLDRGEELEAAAIVRQSGNPALRYPVTKCLRISSSRKGCTAAQKLIVKSGLLAMNSAAS